MRARRATLPFLLGATLLATGPAFGGDGYVGGEADAGAGPRPADAGTSAPAPDAGSADPDQEVIDHLDELEHLELLQHLGLLDESGEDQPPSAPPSGGSQR
jgi:hypothetical protein